MFLPVDLNWTFPVERRALAFNFALRLFMRNVTPLGAPICV
jgi:hypothetical protein